MRARSIFYCIYIYRRSDFDINGKHILSYSVYLNSFHVIDFNFILRTFFLNRFCKCSFSAFSHFSQTMRRVGV